MMSRLQFKLLSFGRHYSAVWKREDTTSGPLDNSINCSETNVIVMPQITSDAVYSGSDLFSIFVYNNKLDQSISPPFITLSYISSYKLRFNSIRIRCGTQRSISYRLRILVRTLTDRQSVIQTVNHQRHSAIVVVLRVSVQGIVRVCRFSLRTNESCVRCYEHQV